MEVDGHAEVTTSLAEQADKPAAAFDPHTGILPGLYTYSASMTAAVLSCCKGMSCSRQLHSAISAKRLDDVRREGSSGVACLQLL